MSIVVLCNDGSSGKYRARYRGHTATSTISQDRAVASVAAKALGLCDPRAPAGTYPADYCAAVREAAAQVKLTRLNAEAFAVEAREAKS